MKRVNLIKSQLNSKTSNSDNDYKLLKITTSSMNNQIKIVEINNPKTLNSISYDFVEELVKCLQILNNDNETKVVILTGSGKSFISGADITTFRSQSYKDYLKSYKTLFDKGSDIYYWFNKPLIAAVNGYCFGGGLEIALCCDMIFCSEKATLGLPEIKLGLIPGCAGTQKLTKIFGIIKTNEFILSGKNIDLNEAHSRGLINSIIKHDELMSHVQRIANDICKYDITALISAKKAIKNSLEVGLSNGIQYEKSLFLPLFDSLETQKEIDNFLNKNKKK